MKVLYNNAIIPANEQINGKPITDQPIKPAANGFQEILKNKIIQNNVNQPIQFSKHANMRLSARDISLSSEQLQRVEDGVTRAMHKGINDSLVLVDNIALVVNIRNKTVITAIAGGSENIFTNIDGAVIV